jgi:N-methylhydantoinase A
MVRTHVGEVQKLGSAELRHLFADMEGTGRARLATAFSGPTSVRRAADMRYGEQIFEIAVPLDGVDINAPDLIERFHRRHEELYTYSAPDQEVVLVNARLAVVGELPMLPAEPVLDARETLPPQGSRRVYLGSWQDVPVYRLDACNQGMRSRARRSSSRRRPPSSFAPATASWSLRTDGSISELARDEEAYGTD